MNAGPPDDDQDGTEEEGRDDERSDGTPLIDPNDDWVPERRPKFVYDVPASALADIFPGYVDGGRTPSFFESPLAKHEVQAILERYPEPRNCRLRLFTPEAALPTQAAKGKSVPSDREFTRKYVTPLTDILRPCLRMLAQDDVGAVRLHYATRASLVDMVRLISHHLAHARHERVLQVFGTMIPAHVVAHATAPRVDQRDEALCDAATVEALQRSITLSASIAKLRETGSASRPKSGKPGASQLLAQPCAPRPSGPSTMSARRSRDHFRGPSQFSKGPHDTGTERPPRGAYRGRGRARGGRHAHRGAA